jgi:hypothetical protein
MVFEPQELIEKLAALVPPPRLNLVRYHSLLKRRRARFSPMPYLLPESYPAKLRRRQIGGRPVAVAFLSPAQGQQPRRAAGLQWLRGSSKPLWLAPVLSDANLAREATWRVLPPTVRKRQAERPPGALRTR